MQDERLRTSLGNALVRMFRLVNRTHNRALAALDLSAEQAHVLGILWVYGAMPMGQLQRLLALSSATLTGAIDRMEAQAMVRRIASPDDKRAYLIEPRLADKRRRQIEDKIEATEAVCWGGLTAAERKELLRLLDKAIAHLEPEATAR
jgi:DNA-binding MarR family transcriptional regulator